MLGLGKERKQLLLFSRGKGRGHGIVDGAIANELVQLEPKLDITFVSYGMGAATLNDLGQNVIDLELPEDNPLWETMLRITPLLQGQRPALVVSHEEFCVPPLCKPFGLPVVFLTDRFMDPDSIEMQALRYADRVIFLDDRGIYDEPPYLAGQVSYLGHVLRSLDSGGADKVQSRRLLGLPEDSTVILVCPGGSAMHSEARAPLFDLVLGAYDALGVGDRRLVWVAGEPDYGALVEKSRDRHDLLLFTPHYNFMPTIMAADIVVTNGSRHLVLECEALGVPSISVSYSDNPFEDSRLRRIETNIALRGRGLDQLALRNYMVEALARATEIGQMPRVDIESRRRALAKVLQSHL
jgi:hypothetical protein